MKTLMFVLLMAGKLIAQPAILKTSFEQMEAIGKEVPTVTLNTYSISKNEYVKPMKAHRYVYKSDKYELVLIFTKVAEGANRDLEIEGTPVYKFQSASGQFLDLFRVWQKYFDATADPDKVIKEDYAMITVPDADGGTDNVVLKRGSTDWIIVIRP